VAGLDLRALLEGCQDLLDTFGGHALAAGLTVARARLPELRARFEELARARVAPGDLVPELRLDGELPLAECDLALCDWLERMTPHGLGNPEPVFLASDVRIQGASAVGDGKHLRLRVRDATGTAEAIGFGMGDEAAGLAQAGACSIAFTPIRNTWRQETRCQLRLRGTRRS
jgi:single-stranded-DNA-specific exonuclease